MNNKTVQVWPGTHKKLNKVQDKLQAKYDKFYSYSRIIDSALENYCKLEGIEC